MEDYTLRISETDSKALALMTYLKSLDFVQITKSMDWWDDLNEASKKSIELGIKQADEGKLTSNHKVRERIDGFFKKNG